LILAALRRNGLPRICLYICMIESCRSLDTPSRGQRLWRYAGGARTRAGGEYWLDERNDPEKSMKPRCYYFRDLIDRSAIATWHWRRSMPGTALVEVMATIRNQ